MFEGSTDELDEGFTYRCRGVSERREVGHGTLTTSKRYTSKGDTTTTDTPSEPCSR